jgi:hypothetical protein
MWFVARATSIDPMSPQLANSPTLDFCCCGSMVAAVFITNGWSHLKDPEGRGKSIGMSKGFTIFLGAAEVAGSPSTRITDRALSTAQARNICPRMKPSI